MEKLFSPAIATSNLCKPDREALEAAAVILHSIGWNTQQGMPERGIETLRKMLQQDQSAVIRACASTVEVLRRQSGHAFS